MRKRKSIFPKIYLPLIFVFAVFIAGAQDSGISNDVVSFTKRELNWGLIMGVSKEREELLSDESRFNEERTLLNGKFRFENNYWNLLDYKQERLNFKIEVGPYGGFGDWVDSSKVEYITADQDFYGLRTSANIDYTYRYYYDAKSYTVFDVSAWGRYDLYKQNLDGTSTDSLGNTTPVDESDTKDRLRYGINAKAGWGSGRLSPMNHLMTAHYLLEKYYPGRLFSDYEIAQFAQVIANIKHRRNYKEGHDTEKEMLEVIDFIRSTFVLASPESMTAEWSFSEFDPRYQGNRFEIGPHFKYYNQEPDFLYGGYIQYDNAKYVNVKWNRNFSAGLVYNRYTKTDMEYVDEYLVNDNVSRDWATADINLGWSYYPNLKTQFDFGMRYVPGIELNNFDNVGSLSHNFIPYLAYFTQLNAKSRVKLNLAWRIADGEQFVVPGPEFSLSIYRSKY
ncbi:hypothetical protein SLH46_16025 [Draconibacterium sp. IB214405]|uniref:hypothetical protein n=1 Tax=Draconibacterium sp. IB214405 TaxID=3097352 RepID=UPI002A148D86|nr:hypothetical protein [Draconibacterium sp. IB214405]MDX8340705.1 hypothetical protein [Draconibacterium sp. IB214405]